ncbi:hypothetical protein N2152v2_007672 [Parachlorella kessleri]
MKVDVDRFLTELHKLYERNKGKGTVWVTMKRTNEKPRKSKTDWSHLELKCLVRATDGKRKLSTVVAGKELARFQDSYSTILKAHCGSLKKRERVRGAKQ